MVLRKQVEMFCILINILFNVFTMSPLFYNHLLTYIYRHFKLVFLKSILTYLHRTKHNEINIDHSDVQKHASYTVSHKGFRNDCKCIFNCASRFVSTILNFNTFCDAGTVYNHYALLVKSNRIFFSSY